ncbi:MAG TPA: aldo/keto reductase [Bryobacteraceae bacterium]|nr:aldo/keto reductase [Bryobacteraceae bacterium]
MGISRRRFIETATLGGAVASTALGAPAKSGKLPMRTLGRTGAKVSILAFGSGSRFLMYKDEEEALGVLNHAIDSGINYVDTAASYGDGLSETRVGKVMATRRKEVFLATKVEERNGEKAMRSIESSLKRLQTDHLDLLHIHSLTTRKDLADIEANDGVLKVLYKLRDQKVARAIGVTCHSDPAVLKTALERHDFDCTQMALNAALAGMGEMEAKPGRATSFQLVALPVAKTKNMGIIAMKVFAQEKLTGTAPTETLLRYAMSLPVTTAVAGMPKREHLEANLEVARTFKPLPATEMDDLSRRISAEYKASIDQFFLHHIDV